MHPLITDLLTLKKKLKLQALNIEHSNIKRIAKLFSFMKESIGAVDYLTPGACIRKVALPIETI